jgi:hypothetical protein
VRCVVLRVLAVLACITRLSSYSRLYSDECPGSAHNIFAANRPNRVCGFPRIHGIVWRAPCCAITRCVLANGTEAQQARDVCRRAYSLCGTIAAHPASGDAFSTGLLQLATFCGPRVAVRCTCEPPQRLVVLSAGGQAGWGSGQAAMAQRGTAKAGAEY